ncbi:uncharacterized protein LOC111125395 isoform X2 [Crassostrea virginica]
MLCRFKGNHLKCIFLSVHSFQHAHNRDKNDVIDFLTTSTRKRKKYIYKTKETMDNSAIISAIEEKNGVLKGQMENCVKKISIVIKQKINDLKTDTENAHEELKDVLQEEIKKIQNQKGNKKANAEIKTAFKEGFEKLEADSKKYQKEVKSVLRNEFDNLKNFMKVNEDVYQNGGCYMLLAVKIVLMIAVIVFYCASHHISEVQPCELKAALDSVYLNYTFQPCKYGAIKDISDKLTGLGKAQFWSNSIITVFIIISIFFSRLKKDFLRFSLWIFLSIFVISAIALLIASALIYNEFDQKKNEHTNIDYGNLQSSLLSWFQISYKSDNINNSDKISRGWNNLFIQYDCCAVREVLTTTNDFDNTPWCTTSGSCQATSSQIPKTCCNFVTQDDYQNAPTNCHASVTPGTYRPNCISRIRGMAVVNIDESQVSTICMSLLSMIVFQGVFQFRTRYQTP